MPIPSPFVWAWLLLELLFDGALVALFLRERDALLALISTPYPGLMALIALCFALGVGMTWVNLLRLRREGHILASAARSLPGASEDLRPWALALPASGVGQRLMALSLSPARLKDGDVAGRGDQEALEERWAALGRYLTGVLTMLGLVGTFLGLLLSIEALEGLLTLKDFEAFFTGVVGALEGMGTAFGTSLMGVGFAVVLGFEQLIVRLAGDGVIAATDRFVLGHLSQRLGEEDRPQELAVEVARLRGALSIWRADGDAAGLEMRAAAEALAQQSAAHAEGTAAILHRLDDDGRRWARLEERLGELERLAGGENRRLLDLIEHSQRGAAAWARSEGAGEGDGAGAGDGGGPARGEAAEGAGADLVELRRMNDLLANIYREMNLVLRTAAGRMEGGQAELLRLMKRILQRSDHQATQGTHQILLLQNLLKYLGEDEARLKRLLDEVAKGDPGKGDV